MDTLWPVSMCTPRSRQLCADAGKGCRWKIDIQGRLDAKPEVARYEVETRGRAACMAEGEAHLRFARDQACSAVSVETEDQGPAPTMGS